MFEEYYQKAPEEIRNVVDSSDTSDALGDIARKYGVDVNGFGNPVIGRLTGRILVGMTHPKDFVPSLEKELGVTDEIARAIVKDINDMIFANVKGLLIEIHGLNKGTQQQAPSSNPSPEDVVVKGLHGAHSTPPELFEKKLHQSVLSHAPTQPPIQTKTAEPPKPSSSDDPYRETA